MPCIKRLFSSRSARWPLAAALGLALVVGIGFWRVDRTVTYHDDVAPLILNNCAQCHRPGQSGPFSLLTYRQVKKRARQILEVTQSGFMPPFLPAAEEVSYQNQRELTQDQIRLLETWVKQGAAEGDPANAPSQPEWNDEWPLGEPDLTVQMREVYTLPAGGKDVYRNFVIPIGVPEKKWVKTVDLRPGNPKVVHHAVLMIDRTEASARLARQSKTPGFGGGMATGGAHLPDGHFMGWTPGKSPFPGYDEMAWELTPGTDFVLQLHMRPSGKPEPIQPTIGLYFSDQAPTLHPYALVLRNKQIDIPPGESKYRLRQSYKLPVDVLALAVYPHAHYLGKELKGYAELPDGTRQTLIHIPRWDFNWQDEYRYQTPIELPRDTVIHMDYTYDNSAGNVFNPHQPPQRVTYGPNSTDEMGELMLQVLPKNKAQRQTLIRHKIYVEIEKDIARQQRALEKNPEDLKARNLLVQRYQRVGDFEKAYQHARKAAEQARGAAPETASIDSQQIQSIFTAHFQLGQILASGGRWREAAQSFHQAAQVRPESGRALYWTGHALAQTGAYDQAIPFFEQALKFNPDQPEALNSLARLLTTHPRQEARKPEEGLKLARKAAEVTEFSDPGVLDTLAVAQAAAGRFDEAAESARQAIRLAESTGAESLAQELRSRLELFENNQPYR